MVNTLAHLPMLCCFFFFFWLEGDVSRMVFPCVDWEAAVPSLLASPSPVVVQKASERVKEKEAPKQKQRGRGAFTYGGGGNLYSDQSEEDRLAKERLNEASTGAANDHCRCPTLHQASPKQTRACK
jgi:hypothetical protein